MSDEEKKPLPVFDFKNIPIMKSVKIKLDCARPVKSGTNQFGTWNLWFVFVENAKVTWGRGADARIEEGYSGKVLCFPNSYLNEQFIAAAGGNSEVEVQVTKNAEDGPKGPIYKYVVVKLSEGETPQSSLTPGETKFIEDMKRLINGGHNPSESDIDAIRQEKEYGGNIDLERAKKLVGLIK